MNHFKRFLLLVLALAVGGGMGYRLLVGFNFVKMVIFYLVEFNIR